MSIQRILLFIILSGLLLSVGHAKSPPPGTGTGAANVPANILIMLDNSGSMGWGGRMRDAKEVIKDIVTDSTLANGARFGLMEWNSYSPCIRCPITNTSSACILKELNDIHAVGGTYPSSAFIEAEKYFKGGSYNQCSGEGSCFLTHPYYKKYYCSWYSCGCKISIKSGNSPIDPALACQVTAIIFISDGSYGDRPEIIAKKLLANQNIKTFVVGFHSGYNVNYVNLAKGGGTYPDSPIFTSNKGQLQQTLVSYIRQIIASRLTFTAPAVMPAGKTDTGSVFTSTFQVKRDHQWQGRLQRYDLDANGEVGDLFKTAAGKEWDAGALLNERSAASRNIWTVGASKLCSGKQLPSGENNFSKANSTVLNCLLSDGAGGVFSDSEAVKLIQFVRGIDSYDEDQDGSVTDERWKLGDIYHSEVRLVGAPSRSASEHADKNSEEYYRYQKGYEGFRLNNANRREVIYVGSNSGMLHAFDYESGKELWAFIPPAMLPRLREMVTTKPNSSISIFGVDGSPLIKDVYLQGGWKTVLISGMRQGGKHYFALDVTDPDNPRYLFGLANDPANSEIQCWDACGKWN